MEDFVYEEMFQLGEDTTTEYRLLSKEYVEILRLRDKVKILRVHPEALSLLAEEAFRDVECLLRPAHLEQLSRIFDDPESSDNDRYVALELLKNAVISAEGVFPMCQDTGTAIVMGRKGQMVLTGFPSKEALSRGIYSAFLKNNFRYSQRTSLSMYHASNTHSNLPADIEIYATAGDSYNFLFVAKGGGSANKTLLFQETREIFDGDNLINFIREKMKSIGTSACPPYHLAIVIGGTTSERNLKTLKLATTGYLENLPTSGSMGGRAYRDLELEEKALEMSREMGMGAQFGGKYFCLDVRVIRLPRHSASCPISVGVSCNAHRNIKGKINKDGIFLEKLERNPAKYLPEAPNVGKEAVQIDLGRPMDEIRATLSQYPVSTRLSLSGEIVVARDIAHARLKERLDRGEELPQYLRDHIIYYAGPAKTPEGYPCGALGPTTAGRMDHYLPLFQQHGASLVTLAKGNRSKEVTESCKKYGGFYLGSIGGVAARLGKECIVKMEVLEYPELEMEAIYMITVKDFPAFIIVDDKGNDFYARFA
ncbi:MAG: FumA C-terminus/TtdB family hydratase beta subunit [Geobacteraceae bacterium]